MFMKFFLNAFMVSRVPLFTNALNSLLLTDLTGTVADKIRWNMIKLIDCVKFLF